MTVGGEGEWGFQWFFNGNSIPDGTQPTLRIPAVAPTDLGSYHVEVRSTTANAVEARVKSHAAFLADEASPVVKGQLRMEVFRHITGRSVSVLQGSPRFPDEPDDVVGIRSWEIPQNASDQYGVRITGYVVPPKTGDYVFYFCCNDTGELYLSEDETPENKKLIASAMWDQHRGWQSLVNSANSISAPIHLEAGRRYWVETHFKEGRLEDNLAVTWHIPGEPPPRDGDPPISGEYLEFRVD